MDHSEAENLRAAERYMLGDLSVSEVEEFERHFFDCPQCSEELRTLSVFQENARAVFLEQSTESATGLATAPARVEPVFVTTALPQSSVSHPPTSGVRGAGSWWSGFSPLFARQWATAFGALLIGAFLSYLAFVPRMQRELDSPQSVSAHPLYAASRGEETVVSASSSATFYTLYFDKTGDVDYSSYRAHVRAASDSSGDKFSVPVPPTASSRPMQILIPRTALAAGRYVLVLSGIDASGKETEVGSYPFTLRFQ